MSGDAPSAHVWVRVGNRLYRCPWCGACRKQWRGSPDPEATSQPEAERHYAMLQATPGKPRLRKPPTRRIA